MSSDYNDGINRQLSRLFTAVEHTRAAISDFSELIGENVEDNRLSEFTDKFVKYSMDYVVCLEDLCSPLVTNLDWVPGLSSSTSEEGGGDHILSCPVELHYADGNSPWSFWLSYTSSTELKHLLVAMQNDYKAGKLKKLHWLPEAGSYVICVDRNVVFRGCVLASYADKIKVRNVDDTCVKMSKLGSIFNLPKLYATLHAQTVECCLTQDESLMKLWNSDLGDMFKNSLKEGVLEVSFLQKCSDCIPPKYLVDARRHGEITVDFNRWLEDRILPHLAVYRGRPHELTPENLPDSVIDPYFLSEDEKSQDDDRYEENLKVGRVDIQGYKYEAGPSWSPQLLVPSNPLLPTLCRLRQNWTGTIAAQYSFTSSLLNGGEHEVLAGSSFVMKPSYVPTTLNVNTPVFEPRVKMKALENNQQQKKQSNDGAKVNKMTEHLKRPDELVDAKLKVMKLKRPAAAQNNSESIVTEVCASYNKHGFCLTTSCTKNHIKMDAVTSSRLHVLPPIEEATKFYTVDVLEDSTRITDLLADRKSDVTRPDDDDNDVTEEPCDIMTGYVPTDDSRVCKFYAEHGECWKSVCTKEHEEIVQYKWTNDKLCTVNKTSNLLILPSVGETVELMVTHIRNSNCFYAHLPNLYSDIGEGVADIETLESLSKSLNDSKNVKFYKSYIGVEPGSGELCLVRGLDSSQKQQWKRAMVLESFKKTYEVFYVDYGETEKVEKDALRLIEDRFNHLPHQAVLCTLKGLYCSFEDSELKARGKKYLKQLIHRKVIWGKVIERNINDTSLELNVTIDGTNVNELMVCQGFCDEF